MGAVYLDVCQLASIPSFHGQEAWLDFTAPRLASSFVPAAFFLLFDIGPAAAA